MTEPFIKRTNYSRKAFLNKEDFTHLLSRLADIGFTNQIILLPSLISDNSKRAIVSGPEENTIEIQTYLEGDIDYDAILLKTTTQDQKEEILILFNQSINKGMSFNEPKFHIVPENASPSFYISTSDPVKTFGLTGYLKDYFNTKVHYGTLVYWGISQIF